VLPLRDGYEDFRAFVNPLLATRAELTGEPYRVVRVTTAGCLVDLDGREVEDFLAGYGTQAFGHRSAGVERALREFLDGDQPVFYTSGVSPLAGLLARRLCERTGGVYGAAFFASGGTEAVEAAMKLARAATGRPRILCLEGAYHGTTMGSVAMMARGPYRDPFGPHLPAIDALPWGDHAALDAALAGGDVAAVVVEPIQVEGGMRFHEPRFLAHLGEATARAGALLVADEIQVGLGRTGRLLVSETWPRRPDVVTLAKALGGGLVPVSVMLSRREPFTAAFGTHATAEAHTSTFSGNGLGLVAGLAVMDLLDDDLLARVRRAGDAFRRALAESLAGLPLVEGVVGDGLLAGIRLGAGDHPWLSFEYLGLPELAGQPAVGFLLAHRLYKAGFLTNVCGHDWSVLRIQPPLTVGEDRLAAFVEACREAVEALCQLQ
jgi:acetylornithine/succinyldiaminopimelate/putrescine aminotransferase